MIAETLIEESTLARLEQLLAREDLHPGPWGYIARPTGGGDVRGAPSPGGRPYPPTLMLSGPSMSSADVEFILESRRTLAALVLEVRRLWDEIGIRAIDQSSKDERDRLANLAEEGVG